MERSIHKTEMSEPPASQIYPKPIVDGILESLSPANEGQLTPFIGLKDMLGEDKQA